MLEETSQFHRTILKMESIVHHQDDVHVIWLRLGGNVTSKHDEPSKESRTLGKFANVSQSLRADPPLSSLRPKTLSDLGPCGGMDTRR